MRHNF
jgi:DNA replication protein DnaC